MRVLVLGASGQLGMSLVLSLQEKGIDFLAKTRSQLDIADLPKLEDTFLTYLPDIVINAAAFTNVDQAESEPFKAHLANVDGVKNIAICCKNFDAILIHFSTDYVFRGDSTEPYQPNDQVNPISVYGTTKLAGENIIQQFCMKYIVLRTSWLFSCYAKNFLTTMVNLSKKQEIISVVSDEIGCPTNTAHLTQVIINSLDRIKRLKFQSGIYHYAGKGECSWYDFAGEIFNTMKYNELLNHGIQINPIKASEYSAIAPRPRYSALNSEHFCNSFDQPHLSWRDDLAETIKKYLKNSID